MSIQPTSSDIGHFLELSGIFCNILSLFSPKNKRSRFFLGAACFLYILTFCFLLYCFVNSDFSIRTIFANSSTLKPLHFKIGASWASHEGSILLWLAILSFIILLYLYFANISNSLLIRDLNNHYLLEFKILSLIAILFSSFSYFLSDPFISMPSHITQAEGLGLNPVLQDIGLVIHPPILYFGYLCYAIPFAITVRWLNYPNNDIDLNLLKTSSKFIRVGLASMTCGIGLGAWWAYRELGWGGYWFFDPVENISLMPWLVGISLHHCMNVTLKNKKLFNWTNTLSLICFPIVVLGAFLVRSGAITSVHSFTSSTGRSIYLLCIFSLISLLSLYSLLRHSRYEIVNLMIKPYSQKFRSLSTPEKGIMIGSCFWICALVVLCCSSIYPIVVMNIKNQIISINYEFFVKFFVPLCLFAGIITASSHSRTTTQRLLQHICLALLLTCVANLKMRTTIIASLAIFSGAFLTISTLHILATSSKYFIELPDRKRVSMILGHLGFGMLILCCCINTVLQKEVDFIGRAGR
jgi:cytochrome c-type biogenesis protein CcmF